MTLITVICAALSIGFLVLLSMRRGKGADYFSPPFFFAVLIFMGFFARALYQGFGGGEWIGVYGEDFSILLYGNMALLLSVVSFSFGYLSLEGRSFVGWERLIPDFSFKWLQILVVVISLFLVFLYFKKQDVFGFLLSGGLSVKKYFITDDGVRTSLTFLTIGGDFLYVLFCVRYFRVGRLKRVGFFYWGVLFLSFLVPFFSSTRSGLILYLLGLVVIYAYINKAVSLKKMMVFSILAIFLIGILGALRDVSRGGQGGVSVVSSVETAVSHLLERPYLLSVDKLSFIVSRSSDRDILLLGESFASIVFLPIPRLFWEDKPSVRVGQFVGKNIYDRGNHSGVPPTFIGELFINFGWVGVVLGMFAFGVFSRGYYNSWGGESGDLVLYSIILTSVGFLLLSADFSGGISRLFRLLVPYMVFKNFYRIW